jgi:hypothetical protein
MAAKQPQTLEIPVGTDYSSFAFVPQAIIDSIQDKEVTYCDIHLKTTHKCKVSELLNKRYSWNIKNRSKQRVDLKLMDPIAPTSIVVAGACPFEVKKDGQPCGVSVRIKYPPCALTKRGEKVIAAHYPIDDDESDSE